MGLSRFFKFLVATSVVTSNLQSSDDFSLSNPIHHLRPKSGTAGHPIAGVSCQSWRFGVETNNLIEWKTIPKECEGYVGHYMLGSQYREDSEVVTEAAYNYAKNLNLTNDGNNIWVFDVDETTLSNLPFYARHGFGYYLFIFKMKTKQKMFDFSLVCIINKVIIIENLIFQGRAFQFHCIQ